MARKIISIIIGIILVAGVAVFGGMFRIREVVVEFVGESSPTVDPAAIYEQCAVNTDGSILALNESAVKRHIAELYPDRSIVVKDIVRKFPDSVTIYVEEHSPICAVPVKTGDAYALADRDFALDKRVGESDLDKASVIIVRGIAVGNTFDTADFAALRAAFIAIEAKGVPTAALPKLFESVTFGDNRIEFETRDGATLAVSRGNAQTVAAELAAAYDEYTATLR